MAGVFEQKFMVLLAAEDAADALRKGRDIHRLLMENVPGIELVTKRMPHETTYPVGMYADLRKAIDEPGS